MPSAQRMLLDAYRMTMKRRLPSQLYSVDDRVQFWEDNGRMCHYCNRKLPKPGTKGGRATQFDHIVAYEDGGTDALSNLVLCCRRCNLDKGKMKYLDFLERKREFARTQLVRLNALLAKVKHEKRN